MSEVSIGKWSGGESAPLDVARLIETRMLVQANSGGGKSWALRRLLEQTAGQVQQLIIDPEGEFSTLRERHDLVIAAAHDGDALAHPKTAKILAERLLETGVSAVLDIYDLKAHERMAFVRGFLDSLVNAPKALWRPVLVVLDEAHIFAPEHGKAESVGSVIDLATRGRKRGFALIAATQRLAKLHKDVAAELLNKLIGRTGLDVDVKRAADELGITAKEALQVLRPLAPGDFYAFGPAINPRQPAVLTIGPVRTTHPKVGDRQLRVPPKPTAAIVAVLPKLADLPKEAEQRERSMDDLRKDLANARRELTNLKREPGMTTAAETELRAALARQEREAGAAEARLQSELRAAYARIERVLVPLRTIVSGLEAPSPAIPAARVVQPAPPVTRAPPIGRVQRVPSEANCDIGSGGKRRLMIALAQNPGGLTVRKLSVLANLSAKGGTWTTYVSSLSQAGHLERIPDGLRITDAGLDALGSYDPLPTGPALIDYWRQKLGNSGKRSIFDVLIAEYPRSVPQDELALRANLSRAGGTWTTYVSALRTLELVEGRTDLRACEVLFE